MDVFGAPRAGLSAEIQTEEHEGNAKRLTEDDAPARGSAQLIRRRFSCLLRRVISRVLFVCTGNFYRSRFAEALFNHEAEGSGLEWRAFSRGLAIHWAEGYLSPYTRAALAARAIDLRHTGPGRMQLSEHDLQAAQRVIALDREEHWPMMREEFPKWADRIEYWDVVDLPFRSSEVALPEIEARVLALLDELSP